jgi:hypothetical protein
MTLVEFTSVAALGLNVVIAIVGLTWGLGKIRETVGKSLEQHREAVRASMDVHRKDFEEGLAMVRREFGETGSALRQKINEVELWSRDNFVKHDTFGEVTDRISREVKDFADRIDKRLERMEGKIDKKGVT